MNNKSHTLACILFPVPLPLWCTLLKAPFCSLLFVFEIITCEKSGH